MGRKAWIFLFLGVALLHFGVFIWIKDRAVIPESWRISQAPPEPTFRHAEARYIDPVTGKKMKVDEFTVRAPSAAAMEREH